MALKPSKPNVAIIISIGSLVVSLLILLLGNNIIDRFSGPKLTMNTIKFENVFILNKSNTKEQIKDTINFHLDIG